MSGKTYGLTSERQRHLLLYVAVFFCFLAVYASTAQRGVSWQDSGEFQYRVLAGDYRWYSGIARAHPLYILMAKGFAALFPRAACFYALNVFSGLGMALALTWVAASVVRLTQSVWAAAASVFLLGFAHMAWWMGTVAEVYTWSLAFLMTEVYCLVRYFEHRESGWLIALFGVNGAHLSVHNFALLGLPVYGTLLLGAAVKSRRKGPALLAAATAVWCLAGGMTVGQSVELLQATGSPVAVIKSLLFGDGYEKQVLGIGGVDVRVWKMNALLAGLSFFNPVWLWSAVGLLREKWVGVRRCLLILTVLHAAFWARYFVPDQATFILPTLGLMSVWAGVGVSSVRSLTGWRWAVVAGCGVLCAVAGPWLVCRAGEKGLIGVRRTRSVPFRNELAYWARPWKQAEDSAAQFVTAVEAKLHAGDVLVADTTAAGPLMAVRAAERSAEDWRLVTPWSRVSDTELQAWVSDIGRTVYIVSPVRGYMPRVLESKNTVFTPDGVLYRVQSSQAQK